MTAGRHTAVAVSTLREELESLGLSELLDDPNLTDIVINEDGSLHTLGYEGANVREEPVSAAHLQSCLATIAGLHRRILDEANPILEASLPVSNIRVTALVPPVTTGPMLVLRIPPRRLLTLDDLEERGSVPAEARALLTEALLDGRTLVIAGSVSSGKTALGSALLSNLITECPAERLVTIEEGSRELQLPARRNITRLLADEKNPTRKLLKVGLRLCPDRIIIGELRGAEALDFTKAALSGHPGLATLHATSARGAVARLTDLLEEAGSPPSPARVARSVDLIVHMTRHRARRFVDEIVRLGDPDARGDFSVEPLYRAPVLDGSS